MESLVTLYIVETPISRDFYEQKSHAIGAAKMLKDAKVIAVTCTISGSEVIYG